MTTNLILWVVVLINAICIAAIFYRFKRQPTIRLSVNEKVHLAGSGIIAFAADTLGLGSSNVNIALAKLTGIFSEDELPAVNNIAQVIPGLIEALFFIHLVDVENFTFVTLIAGICLGGLLGTLLINKLNRQVIRLAMILCFAVMIASLLCHKFHLIPYGAEATSLGQTKLLVGFLAMILCGALTNVGISLFVMVQGVLFLLHIEPLIAFPIMMTAGAIQQPVITMVYLRQNALPLQKTLILSGAGCFGVLAAISLFNYITITWLHSILLCLLAYNFFALTNTFFSEYKKGSAKPLETRTMVAAD